MHTSDNNVQGSGRQYPSQIVNDRSFASVSNSYAPHVNNGLLKTTNNNGLNYNNTQVTNWPDSIVNNDCTKDIFGRYTRQMQTCNNQNTDYNRNNALNLIQLDSQSDNIVVHSDFQQHQQLHCNLTPNSHGNSMLNIHDSYNTTANGQIYRPNSAVTDLSTDSGFISNSPLQHFSPPETTLQNNFQRSKYKEVGLLV